MKKLSLLLGGVILSTAVMAQKPTEGAPMSLEGNVSGIATFGFMNNSAANLNGTSSATVAPIVTPGLRFRYFATENIAVRVSLGFSSNKTTSNFYENEADNSGGAGTFMRKQGTTTIGIGGEYHFKGTEKLSPYAGLDINFGMSKIATEGEQGNNTLGWVAADYAEKSEQKAAGFGVGLVFGTDYYFAENFYLGVELGLGFNSYTAKEGTISTTVAGVTTETKGNEVKQSGFGNNANFGGMFRLGWRF